MRTQRIGEKELNFIITYQTYYANTIKKILFHFLTTSKRYEHMYTTALNFFFYKKQKKYESIKFFFICFHIFFLVFN